MEPPVPLHLLAPDGVALLHVHNALPKAAGTLWEGLNPWGTLRDQPLAGFAIDYDSIREQWAPPTTIPAMPKATAERLDRRAHLDVNVAIVACKLTPELVRSGMQADMDLLSEEQTEILAAQVVPHLTEAAGVLAAQVARNGVMTLNRAEALLWAIADFPSGATRLYLLASRHKLEGEIASTMQHVMDTETLVDRLRSSQPLKSLLQAILAIRNVLAQRGCEGFQLRDLSRLRSERGRGITQGGFSPSVLALAAETLEATHARRCRLRFLRMMAIGRALPKDCLRRKVWAYVDDLGPTPWDVLPLLGDCRGSLCDESAAMTFAQRRRDARQLLSSYIPQVEHAVAHGAVATSERWQGQLMEFRARAVDAENLFRDGGERLVAASASLRSLFAIQCPPRHASSQTADALNVLRGLGQELAKERASLDARRSEREMLARGDLGGRCARKWATVDTTVIQRLATSDPDIFRALLAPSPNAGCSDRGKQNTAKSKASDKAHSKVKAGPVPYIDLAHGGIEGEYVRCPFTRRWVRRRGASGVLDLTVHANRTSPPLPAESSSSSWVDVDEPGTPSPR